MLKQEFHLNARTFLTNKFMDDDDIKEDVARVQLLKKLVSRSKRGDINSRLIMNHLIALFNVFEPVYVIKMLKSSIKDCDWFIMNTALVYLNRSLDFVNVDRNLLATFKEEL